MEEMEQEDIGPRLSLWSEYFGFSDRFCQRGVAMFSQPRLIPFILIHNSKIDLVVTWLYKVSTISSDPFSRLQIFMFPFHSTIQSLPV